MLLLSVLLLLAFSSSQTSASKLPQCLARITMPLLLYIFCIHSCAFSHVLQLKIFLFTQHRCMMCLCCRICKQPIKLGQLSGNHFLLVLRFELFLSFVLFYSHILKQLLNGEMTRLSERECPGKYWMVDPPLTSI